MNRALAQPQRIAILRALQLGDMLTAVPTFRAIRTRFPDAEITLIGLPWAEDFTRRFSEYFDRFSAFPGWPGIAEVPYCARRTDRFLRESRSRHVDLAVQLHGSGLASNSFVNALGADVTAGHFPRGQCQDVDLGLPYPDCGHEIHRNLAIARLLGATECGADLEFPLFPSERARAAALLNDLRIAGRPIIGIHPGASAPARRWLPERFAMLADLLMDECGARVALLGGPGDQQLVEEVARQLRRPVLNLAGHTKLGELAAVIEKVDLFIGNDSGPAHLAAAVGTPSVAIFGPVDPERWRPLHHERHIAVRRPVACSPCGLSVCPIDHRCMRDMSVHHVLPAAIRMLEKRAA